MHVLMPILRQDHTLEDSCGKAYGWRKRCGPCSQWFRFSWYTASVQWRPFVLGWFLEPYYWFSCKFPHCILALGIRFTLQYLIRCSFQFDHCQCLYKYTLPHKWSFGTQIFCHLKDNKSLEYSILPTYIVTSIKSWPSAISFICRVWCLWMHSYSSFAHWQIIVFKCMISQWNFSVSLVNNFLRVMFRFKAISLLSTWFLEVFYHTAMLIVSACPILGVLIDRRYHES
jgi:hypothetical protein